MAELHSYRRVWCFSGRWTSVCESQLIQGLRGQGPCRASKSVWPCTIAVYTSGGHEHQPSKQCALQGLFAVVFALSANLLLLILSEILNVLTHRSVTRDEASTVPISDTVFACDQNTLDHLESGHPAPPGHHSCSLAILSMLQAVITQP